MKKQSNGDETILFGRLTCARGDNRKARRNGRTGRTEKWGIGWVLDAWTVLNSQAGRSDDDRSEGSETWKPSKSQRDPQNWKGSKRANKESKGTLPVWYKRRRELKSTIMKTGAGAHGTESPGLKGKGPNQKKKDKKPV